MLIEANFKKSPIKEGVYIVKIDNIELKQSVETQYGIRDKLIYTFKFFYQNMTYKIAKTVFFVSKDKRSRYMKFVNRLCINYNDTSIDLRQHIGNFVEAYFTVHTTDYGDEFLELLEYGPTDKSVDENKFEEMI